MMASMKRLNIKIDRLKKQAESMVYVYNSTSGLCSECKALLKEDFERFNAEIATLKAELDKKGSENHE